MAQSISYKTFNINNLQFSELTDEKKALKRSSYCSYNSQRFNIQTPKMKLDSGGIPRLGEYNKTDKDRQYIDVALDPCDDSEKTRETKELFTKRLKETTKFKNLLEQIDTKLDSDEFRTDLFGKAETEKYKYKYYPIVKKKITYEDESDDEDKPKIKYPDKCKMKYYAYDMEGNYVGPQCELYLEKSDSGRDRVDTNNMAIDDFKKYVGYMRDMKFVFRTKLWADKKKSRTEPISYGLSIFIVRIAVEEREKHQNQDFEKFLDSDDDDEEEEVVSIQTSLDAVNTKDEEDFEEVKPKRRTRKKNV
tara:strand:+ start:776 stop:1690 length:915 start_codon:yes stop_codon:yes gene_type:complete